LGEVSIIQLTSLFVMAMMSPSGRCAASHAYHASEGAAASFTMSTGNTAAFVAPGFIELARLGSPGGNHASKGPGRATWHAHQLGILRNGGSDGKSDEQCDWRAHGERVRPG